MISAVDVDDIYKIPLLLHEQGLDEIVVRQAAASTRRRPTCASGTSVVDAPSNPTAQVDIAMVGKYVDLTDSYKSLNEALMPRRHAARARAVNVQYIDSDGHRDATARDALAGMDAILVPGGFGERGIEGKIAAVRYAREHGIPYLGICLGMQLAVIEFARNVAGPRRAPTAPSSTARRRIR